MDNPSLLTPPSPKPTPFQLQSLSFSYLSLFPIQLLLSLILLPLLSFHISTLLSQTPILNTSSIITTPNEIQLISEWIHPKAKIKYSLLYKASVDGDSSLKFHELCDNKGPTLTLVSTVEGWKFGGFTEIPWESKSTESGWVNSRKHKTFIFSLNLKKLYPTKDGIAHIYCGKLKGPSFGGGFDFSIMNNSLHKQSTCYSPVSFANLDSHNEFNGGKEYFLAKEVEVYSVKVI